MKPATYLCRFVSAGAVVAAAMSLSIPLSTSAQAAGPQIVSGPSADPEC